jgi:hypothetical protein
MAIILEFRKFLLKSEGIYPFPLEEAVPKEENKFQNNRHE